MQQILEYSFARVLVRLIGVIFVVFALLSAVSLLDWALYLALEDSTTRPAQSISSLLRSILPAVARVAIYGVFGVYLARDGHILARILIAGMHGKCRRCGYDIRDTIAPACPECGTPIVRAAETGTAPTDTGASAS